MRERYLGVKIPPTNLKPDFLGQAQAFANKLADSLNGGSVPFSRKEHVNDQPIDCSELPIRRPPSHGGWAEARRVQQPDWSLIRHMKPREGPRRCRWR